MVLCWPSIQQAHLKIILNEVHTHETTNETTVQFPEQYLIKSSFLLQRFINFDMAKWLESFELITNSVRVNGDDKALIFEEHSRCVCKPEFAGGPICTDRSCLNFATQTECLECRSTCQNCRFQKKKYANLEVRETSWKGHGLYANEDLKKGQFLMEYLGELISSAELSSRMDGLTDKHLYVLQLKPGNYLDARNKGTIGRFINHSCEPNCTIELWTVNGRIRVGIFALTDIERESELSFDYKWSRSNRPPTKCHCGTASCRGFLEIMTAQEIEEIKVRKGLWRHKKDDISAMLQLSGGSLSSSDDLNSTDSLSADGASPDNKQTGIKSILKVKADLPANSLFDLRGRLIPERVVGKRLRIWWEGNQAFFEADVLEYVPKSGRYMCHYLADDTTTDEGLSEAASVWSWLDETQNEAVIRKKVR
jgi:histone-lysine N-methyltransferase SETD2